MSDETAGNCRSKLWNSKHERAAELVALGVLTEPQIAAEVGCSERTLRTWKHDQRFLVRVEHHLAVQRAAVEAEGIANRQNRVRSQNDRWQKMLTVFAERAADPTFARVPGWQTGLLVHTVKGVGRGEYFQLIDLYEVDTGTLRELRELEKHAATELGQWTEKQETSGVVQVQRIIDVEVATPVESQ